MVIVVKFGMSVTNHITHIVACLSGQAMVFECVIAHSSFRPFMSIMSQLSVLTLLISYL